MPWTFVRPRDASLLAGRPLLDLGTGDGQTIAALAGLDVIAMDRLPGALRAARRTGHARLVAGDVTALPFAPRSIRVVVGADVLHHFEDVAPVLSEAARVLDSRGRLVAWWYAEAGRGGPGDPRFPRPYEPVAEAALRAGFGAVEALELDVAEGMPATVGMTAVR